MLSDVPTSLIVWCLMVVVGFCFSLWIGALRVVGWFRWVWLLVLDGLGAACCFGFFYVLVWMGRLLVSLGW